MNYKIDWLPEAEAELATVWLASTRRNEITRAVNLIEKRLALLGPREGESRSGQNRISIEHPIAVIFRFDAATNTAIVGHVWESRKRI